MTVSVPKRVAVFLLSLTGMASLACADIIQFTTLPADYLYNTYNGFAAATIDGLPGQYIICDDYNHVTYVPSGDLGYNVETLNSLAGARFANNPPGQADYVQYDQAALLVYGLIAAGPNASNQTVADYQYALWHLFTPAAPLQDSFEQQLLNTVSAEAQSGNPAYNPIYSQLAIYTPQTAYASNQEFLAMAQVPEPSSLILTGTALVLVSIGLGVLRRKRRRRFSEALRHCVRGESSGEPIRRNVSASELFH